MVLDGVTVQKARAFIMDEIVPPGMDAEETGVRLAVELVVELVVELESADMNFSLNLG